MAFDPKTVVLLLKLALGVEASNVSFEKKWNESVDARVRKWKTKREGHQHLNENQLRFESHVVEYVDFLWSDSRSGSNVTMQGAAVSHRVIHPTIPLYGPRFTPPTFLDIVRRQAHPEIEPEPAYLTPVFIAHPFYYPNLIRCPTNASHKVAADGWTSSGSRLVHGIHREENAIGYQIRCKECKDGNEPTQKGKKTSKCFSMTSPLYWENEPYWNLPGEMPHFFRKCAITRDLYNLTVELRLSLPSSTLETHLKQLHLLTYHTAKLEYVNLINSISRHTSEQGAQPTVTDFFSVVKDGKRRGDEREAASPADGCGSTTAEIAPSTSALTGRARVLMEFSKPYDPSGYNNKCISDEKISDVYLHFAKTRMPECSRYLRTTHGEVIVFDHTFKFMKKAMLTSASGQRQQVFKGGLFTVINEKNEILLYRFCQSQGGDDFGESLQGYVERCRVLGVSLPEGVVTDLCCQVSAIVRRYLPDSWQGLDLLHFLMRYFRVILYGNTNPHRHAVIADIRDAMLEKPAQNGEPAVYRKREVQEQRLVAVWEKYSTIGSVWSDAAVKTHAEQMRHVRKGCLTRPRNDIRSDGSRIEGSHKGWNNIQRAQPSGFEMMSALGADHVLRRNIRIITASKEFSPTDFVKSTFGSHHILLVDHTARVWNGILERHEKLPSNATFSTIQPQREGVRKVTYLSADTTALPLLPDVQSGETFGAVESRHASTFGGLLSIKGEDEDNVLDVALKEGDVQEAILQDMNIDVSLINIPESKIDPITEPGSGSTIAIDSPTNLEAVAGNSDPYAMIDPQLRPTPAELSALNAMQAALPSTVNNALAGLEDTSVHKTEVSIRAADAMIPRGETPSTAIDVDSQAAIVTASSTTSASPGKKRKLIMDLSSDAGSSEAATITAEAPLKRIRVAGTVHATSEGPGDAIHQFFRIHGVSGATAQLSASNKTNTPTNPSSHADGLAADTNGVAASASPASSRLEGPSKSGCSSHQPNSPLAVPPIPCVQDESGSQVANVIRPASQLTIPLPAPPTALGLTKSQALFAATTGQDPTSLYIGRDREYFVFMAVRAQKQWLSHRMNSRSYVLAAADYNRALVAAHRNDSNSNGMAIPAAKHPRAIFEQLAKTETDILRRLAENDFTSKGSGKTAFWSHHCHAVKMTNDSIDVKAVRARGICQRCHVIMYPDGKKGSGNHKRGLCSDGFPTHIENCKLDDGSTRREKAAPWPQPAGVFYKDGDTKKYTFSPIAFLNAVCHMYEKTVIENDAGNLALEYGAFAMLLSDRTEMINNRLLFRTYPQISITSTTPAALLVLHDGKTYVPMDCLRE